MSRSWNGKALLDSLGTRLWDPSSAFRARIIEFVNEIQDDLCSELPQDFFLFKMKKLLPVEKEIIDLSPQKPSLPSIAISQCEEKVIYNLSTEPGFSYTARNVTFKTADTDLGPGLLTNETLRCKYDVDSDATSGLGPLTSTLVGTATVSSGKLNLNTSNDNYVDYNGSNAPWTNIGSVRFKFTPNYSGAPASSSYLFASSNSEDNIANLVRVLQTGTLIRWDIYDSSGVVAKTVQTGNSFNPTAGQTYEFELNFDTAAGEYRLFIDGTNINGLQSSSAATRTASTGLIRIGKNYTSGAVPGVDGSIDDVQLFSAVQHTSNFTGEVPRTLPIYTEDTPKITLSNSISIGGLAGFSEVATKPSGTEIKYIMEVATVEKYHNGTSWVTSDGTYSQSNTSAEININASSLIAATSNIKVHTFLYTGSDQSTPVLSSVSLVDVGDLINGTCYKARVSFLIYSEDGINYIESEASEETEKVEADLNNQSITMTNIDTYDADTSIDPLIIHRRIYISKKSSTDTDFGEPFFNSDIEDNTTTQLILETETSSTVTPPSDTEVDQLSSRQLYFNTGNRYLLRVDQNQIKRFSPTSSPSTTPSSYDFSGITRIFLYPKLSSGSTTAQRTLVYWVLRRPHEIFYDINRVIDLPITAKIALKKGVEWLAYDYRDRNGKQGKEEEYIRYKKQFLLKMRRQKGAPSHVRDVNGNTQGYEF